MAGISATYLSEADDMRKKVIYMNFCGNNKYYRDFKTEILLEAHDDKSPSFEGRLNDLLEISSQEYVMKHEETMKYYMGDPLDSPKDRIRKEINEIIFSKPDYIGTST
mgnify:CR=1 FL=1